MTVPFNAVSSVGFSRTEPLLTVQQLKERYLVGIDLTDYKGNPIQDSVIQHHLNTALSYLETKLDLIILKTKFTEEYDYRAIDYINFNFIKLKKRPLIDVDEIKAQFPSNKDLVVYPKEWYVVEQEASQVQLSPVQGTFSGLVVTQGGSYIPLLFGSRDHWPHMLKVTYNAGFCDDQIPIIVNEMIGMQASIRMFEILGDVMFGPGITSESVSLDGASTSKSIANSAKYALFSGRITSYKEQMKDYIESVRKYYVGIPTIVG